jgi:regulator of ribonuclease activity A
MGILMNQSSFPATADLFDAHPDASSCALPLRSFGLRRRFAGRVRTVKSYQDNVLLKELLSKPSQGEVLVVDGGGSLQCALVGDMIAMLGMNSGWAGVIVNGAIRDSVTIDAMEFGIKALGTNPRKSTKNGDGLVDVPVSFGGVTFVPGHWLYSDEDGILVSPSPLTA